MARHLPVLLRPAAQPWAVRPASGAVVVAVLVLGVGTAAGRPVEAGLTYFGVACAAVFVTGRHYRVRVALVGAQAAGAIIGMAIGAVLPTSTAWVVAVATVVAGLCGAIGSIGPASTAFGMMGVIGLAFTQFSRLGMPWWEPPLWYLLGSGLVLAAGLVGALHHPRRYQRAALAEVFAAAAALVRAPGGDTGARARLARASAGAREAVLGYRIRQPGTGEIDRLWTVAEATALRVASHVPDDASDAAELDRFAEAVREGRETLDVKRRPALGRPAIPWDRVRDRDALLVGARLAVCVGVATLVASLLHTTEHAYWIPLTVATVLRPEYGSVFARFVHRALGTVAGVLLMACTLSLTTLGLGADHGRRTGAGLRRARRSPALRPGRRRDHDVRARRLRPGRPGAGRTVDPARRHRTGLPRRAGARLSRLATARGTGSGPAHGAGRRGRRRLRRPRAPPARRSAARGRPRRGLPAGPHLAQRPAAAARRSPTRPGRTLRPATPSPPVSSTSPTPSAPRARGSVPGTTRPTTPRARRSSGRSPRSAARRCPTGPSPRWRRSAVGATPTLPRLDGDDHRRQHLPALDDRRRGEVFAYVGYDLDPDRNRVVCRYRLDDRDFRETFTFPRRRRLDAARRSRRPRGCCSCSPASRTTRPPRRP